MPFIKLIKWSLNQIAENEASHTWEKLKGHFRIRKAVPPTLHTLLYMLTLHASYTKVLF